MAQTISLWGATYQNVPAVTLPKQFGGTATFTDVSDTTAAAADVAAGKYFYTAAGARTQGTASGGGGYQLDTATATASNYPTSLNFTGLKGEPVAFAIRCASSITSSGNTSYYYVINMTYDGTSTKGNAFRVGSTRAVNNITSGYSWSYSDTTLTAKSSAASRSASPGAFYSGTYELVYVY